MAAVELTISGVMYDKVNRTTQNVVIFGEASLTGLGVGGGPIIPPGQPPGIWGPNDPRPSPPIYIPPEGTEPPIDTKPPGADDWTWIWTVRGWALLPPGGGGKPQPVP